MLPRRLVPGLQVLAVSLRYKARLVVLDALGRLHPVVHLSIPAGLAGINACASCKG